MYDIFYNKICPNFQETEGNLVELAYFDTDGMIVKVTTQNDVFEILQRPTLSNLFDRTVYPVGHPLKGNSNKGIIGCLKDECAGRELYEVVALRPKMYAYRFSSQSSNKDGKSEKLKAKGIKRQYVKRHLQFKQYKELLLNSVEVKNAKFNLIRSRKFELTSVTVEKKSLSGTDDKRKIMEDGIKTLAWGHYRLRDLENEIQKKPTVEDSDDEIVLDGLYS